MDRRRFVSSICATTLVSTLDQRSVLSAAATQSESSGAAALAVWPRPSITPVPAAKSKSSQPAVNLGGKWKFTLNPPERPWENGLDLSSWADINVPGECTTQGFAIARDSEYPFRTSVMVPAGFRGQRILLRFDGVYSYARLWVNGAYVRDHQGGFTSWEADITGLVRPGEKAAITLGVTDRGDDISYGSHYAKHSIGGILRDVRLIAVPASHLTRCNVATEFDSSYSDAVLEVTVAAALREGRGARVRLRLTDFQNREVTLTPAEVKLTQQQAENTVRIPVNGPRKWDAEHPNLYTLQATLVVDGAEVEQVEREFGFRKVEVSGNRILVNGKEVKLRGVCRHSVHPLHGRSISAELDELDARLLRDANVNFVRTSHYPPTESFLRACDRYGIYVEEETAVCFQMKETGSTSDPNYESRFLNQFAEMIERDRSHPSVISWSLGNESRWGRNIAKEFAYAKREDASRPVIFSYPDTIPAGTAGYDLLSKHYPPADGDLRSPRFPKLYDEYAHIACYNLEKLRSDPGVRNFWGESLKRFWENCFTSDGCLGGAIWAGFDEVFMLPDGPAGYGYWGIVDGWRRQKPEHFLTRKAYSPIRISGSRLPNPGAGNTLQIPVDNWFDHTDFGELTIGWKTGEESGAIRDFHLAPHSRGTIVIPPRGWKNGDTVKLQFRRADGLLADEHEISIGKSVRSFRKAQGPAPKVMADANSITISGADFNIVFSKATGLITRGQYRGVTLIESGPYLSFDYGAAGQWWLDALRYETNEREAIVSLSGQAKCGVDFEIRIDGTGLITTRYRLTGEPAKPSEVGVSYLLTEAIDRLSWERDPLWSAYPPDHIGRAKGAAARNASHENSPYRSEPSWSWSEDTQDFFLFGSNDGGRRGTNDFRSTKENIRYASCIARGGNLRVRSESSGPLAVRAEVQPDDRVLFHLNNLWGYPDLAWGNYANPVHVSSGYSNGVTIRLTDNDESDLTYESGAAE